MEIDPCTNYLFLQTFVHIWRMILDVLFNNGRISEIYRRESIASLEQVYCPRLLQVCWMTVHLEAEKFLGGSNPSIFQKC